ncbi:MAG TPA: 3-oxoacyl-[acyl-carrier-protein] synthase III C-terminal domain-containing protein [Allosphingosinicella sp.]|nr:3-oxoacyl-[acyl-carrier-protein] synthase III C-terminal domain-containing protein [Allosphingosinicella sp.]
MGATPLKITGTGTYHPLRRVSSEQIDKKINKAPGWTEANFKIRERGVASPEETTSSMGAAAAMRALDAAGTRPCDLDVIIGACGVMEQPIPGTSVLIQHKLRLGSSGIPAFDVNATCLSFLAALDVVAMGFDSRRWSRALIVSSDIASAALDFTDPGASVIFGDGAAAAVIERCEDEEGPSLLGICIETYGSGFELCELRSGGTRLRPHEDLEGFLRASSFRMDGPGVYRAARKRAPRLMQKLLSGAGVTLDDVALVIPHQASAHGLSYLHDVLGIEEERIVNVFHHCGNQIAASMPTALHEAVASGRLKRGDLALMIGTAAGISIGASVVRY